MDLATLVAIALYLASAPASFDDRFGKWTTEPLPRVVHTERIRMAPRSRSKVAKPIMRCTNCRG